MKTISAEQYRSISKDYKGVIKGQKTMLVLVNGATVIEPVNVIKQSKINDMLEAAFYEVGYGMQINMMNLSKISKLGEVALLNGDDYKLAIANAVDKYREN